MFDTRFRRNPAVVVLDDSASLNENGSLSESFGIRIYDGSLAPFAQRGASYPCQGSYTFSTNEDGQDQITLSFFRGTDNVAARCKFLGEVRLRGFKRGKAREPLGKV